MPISRRNLAIGSIGAFGVASLGRNTFGTHHVALAAQSAQETPGTLKWKFRTGDWYTKHDPNFSGTPVVVSSGSDVIAFDPENGNYVWQFESTSDYIVTTVADDLVYVADWDKQLYALDLSSGDVVWSTSVSGAVHVAPSEANGILLIVGGNLHAVDARTGVEKWRHDAHLGVHMTPSVANDLVFFGDGDQKLNALDLATGELRWQVGADGQMFGTPAFAHNNFYIADGSVYALDSMTGNEIWRYSARVSSDITISGEVAYVGIGGDVDAIVALDALSGQELWTFPTGAYNTVAPLVHEGIVYAWSHDGILYALDANTGVEIWRFNSENWDDSPDAWILEEKLVFYSPYGIGLVCLDRQSGSELWRSDESWSDEASFVLSKSHVIVGTPYHHVYALDVANGSIGWQFSTGSEVLSVNPSKDVVIAADVDYIYALAPDEGKLTWNASSNLGFDEEYWYGRSLPIYVQNGRVIHQNGAGIRALNLETGSEEWRLPDAGELRAVVEGVAIVGSEEDTVAIDAESGGELWRWSREDRWPISLSLGIALFGDSDSSILSIEPRTGDKKWSTPPFDFETSYLQSLVISDIAIFLVLSSGSDSELIALEALSGDRQWSRSFVDDWLSLIPVPGAVLIISGSDDKETILCVDALSGVEKWSFVVSAERVVPMVASSNTLFFDAYHGDSTTTSYAIDLSTGGVIWSLFEERYESDALAVFDGTLYQHANDSLRAFSPETGSHLWSFGRQGAPTSPLANANGAIYFGSNDLHVYAITAEPTRYPSVTANAAASTTAEAPVLAAPLASGTVVTTLPAGTEVFVSGASQNTGGVTWWPVITPDGTDGWIDGSLLRGN